MKKLTIWSNRNINPDDWKADYLDSMEMNECDMDECKLWDYIHDTLSIYLDDERANLNVETNGRILVIADLGLWDGRHQGYKIYANRNVNAIFNACGEYFEVYSDGPHLLPYRLPEGSPPRGVLCRPAHLGAGESAQDGGIYRRVRKVRH